MSFLTTLIRIVAQQIEMAELEINLHPPPHPSPTIKHLYYS